jgi:hypothetical protein
MDVVSTLTVTQAYGIATQMIVSKRDLVGRWFVLLARAHKL